MPSTPTRLRSCTTPRKPPPDATPRGLPSSFRFRRSPTGRSMWGRRQNSTCTACVLAGGSETSLDGIAINGTIKAVEENLDGLLFSRAFACASSCPQALNILKNALPGWNCAAAEADTCFARLTASLKRLRKNAAPQETSTTGAEAHIDCRPFTRPSKGRSSTVLHAFGVFPQPVKRWPDTNREFFSKL